MRIRLITPAGRRSRSGNRTTAVRWARLLRGLGHRVDVSKKYGGEPADLMVAIHAWRSAEAVARWRGSDPARPLVVALAGTDIYRFQHSHPEATLRSMALADGLVCLHALVHEAIPARFGGKLTVIYQSAPPLPRPSAPSRRNFTVSLVCNLREEKDPLRTAEAVRDLPAASRLRVVHVGKAMDEAWAGLGRAEMARNPRYRWLGEVPGWQVRRLFGRSHLMVLSSRMEGGANVVSEAVVAGLPVIASDIHGNVGLLGRDYPGYYPVEDAAALGALLWRAEREPGFLDDLRRRGAALAPLFRPQAEQAAWRALLQRLA